MANVKTTTIGYPRALGDYTWYTEVYPSNTSTTAAPNQSPASQQNQSIYGAMQQMIRNNPLNNQLSGSGSHTWTISGAVPTTGASFNLKNMKLNRFTMVGDQALVVPVIVDISLPALSEDSLLALSKMFAKAALELRQKNNPS
jgi:hypothetical protein